MSQGQRPGLLSWPTLRLCLLRGLIAAGGQLALVGALVVAPLARTLHAGRILVYAALVGLAFGPVSWLERVAQRGSPADPSGRLIVAGIVAFSLMLLAEWLAWSQANYTFGVLESGGPSGGARGIAESGTLSRRPEVASVLLLVPAFAASLGLYAYGAARGRRALAKAWALTALCSLPWVGPIAFERSELLPLAPFAALSMGAPLLALVLADRLDRGLFGDPSAERGASGCGPLMDGEGRP